jgi:hypothetical protein
VGTKLYGCKEYEPMVYENKSMVEGTKTYSCGKKLFIREKNLLLGKQTISCGNKSMV